MTAAPERGFGLVELLVALAISATGLLAEALLLRQGLAAEGAALRREQATALAAALAERIRQNSAAGAAYALPAGAVPPSRPACAATASCTPAELAAVDLADWLEGISAALPAAAASVEYTPAVAGDQLDLRLSWAEPGETVPAALGLTVLASTVPR